MRQKGRFLRPEILNSVTYTALFTLLIVGCAEDPSLDTIISYEDRAADDVCTYGGTTIQSGVDLNNNGVLDANEVSITELACFEAPITLIASIEIGANEDCEYGGLLTQSGEDINRNEVLDEDEVSTESLTCYARPAATLYAQNQQVQLNEDSTISGLVAIESGSQGVSFQLTQSALHGSVNFAANGDYSYTPNSNFYGTDSFSFFATNGVEHSDIGVVEIEVQSVNDSPIVSATEMVAFRGQSSAQQIEVTDVDDSLFTYAITSAPTQGAATLSQSGVLVYTTSNDAEGEDAVTVTVSDGQATIEHIVDVTISGSFIELTQPLNLLELPQGSIETHTLTFTNRGSSAVSVWPDEWPSWVTPLEEVVYLAANDEASLNIDVSVLQAELGTLTSDLRFFTSEPGNPRVLNDLTVNVVEDTTAPLAIYDVRVTQESNFHSAELNWSSAAENGYRGLPVAQYDIRYANQFITEANWSSATTVESPLEPLLPGSQESIVVENLSGQIPFYFAVKAQDAAGRWSDLSNVVLFELPTPPELTLSLEAIDLQIPEGRNVQTSLTVTNTGESKLVYTTGVNQAADPLALHGPLLQKSALKTATKTNYSAQDLQGSNGKIIVRYRSNQPNMKALNSKMSSMGLSTREQYSDLNISVLELPNASESEIAKKINELNAMADVAYAEPDFPVYALGLPNDPRFSEQWALQNTGQLGGVYDADIDAEEMWDRYTDASRVIVAVIDTGVNYNHEDLQAHRWINEDEIAENGIDDDGNGFIDDVYGYDFAYNTSDPMDRHDHGTHCAGIIGAQGNNGIGVSGIAQNAEIMAVKFLGDSGSGSISGAISSVIYAVDNGAKILSNSWGGGSYSQAMYDAISYANERGVLFVAAAGNDSSNNDHYNRYPADYDLPNVITVASTNHLDELSYFSNYGAVDVDLAAPGSDVLSSVASGGYESFSGTSMATPYVSGVAALIASNFPNLSAAEIKEVLLTSTDQIPSLAGVVASGGRLNANASLTEAANRTQMVVEQGASAELLANESITVVLNINTVDQTPGEYANQVRFYHNNPNEPIVIFPVNLTVLEDAEAPAAIQDLHASNVGYESIELQWTATGDDGMEGRAERAIVAYSTAEITETNFDAATQVEATRPQLSGELETFTLENLERDSRYYIAVKAIDNSNQASEISNVIVVDTGVGPILEVSPSVIPDVSLLEGQTTSQQISVLNLGDAELEVRLEIAETNSLSLNSYQSGVNFKEHAKGEQDTRRGILNLAGGEGGPDEFGYYWQDSDNGAHFQWEDISNVGTSIELRDDTVSGDIAIGFDFPYYENSYSSLYVSSNGFLTFTPYSSSGCCSGQPIPNNDYNNNIIAWAWRDLHPRNGDAKYHYDGEKFIVQFTNYGEYSGNGTTTAQVILYPSGEIKIQYLSFSSDFRKDILSVGIENETGTDGLQVVFNAAYLEDELAIEFSPALPWVVNDTSALQLQPGESANILLSYDATELSVGRYEAYLIIDSNDEVSQTAMPLALDVVTP